ncbi:DoxX family protein [Egbenema bharatensis]|uniref:DoxX family protein n=1 Tax=Egbenema bharatensis TaxID=3463334 RepID=UPI003A872432
MFVQRYVPVVARTLVTLMFLQSGISKVLDFEGTRQFMAGAGIPLASVTLVFTIAFLIVGSLMVIFGFKARIGSILLLAFLIPATIVFHNPIANPDELSSFVRNLTLMGGLLMVLAYGAGAISIDEWLAQSGRSDSKSFS